MNGLGAGFQYQPKKVSWTKRDVLLYNVSIGCSEPQFVYEGHPKFSAFPTYPLALVFKLDNEEIIDFASSQKDDKIPGIPDLDPKTLVDGQRTLQLFKSLPVTSADRDFEFHSSVLGVYDKGKSGTVVESEDSLIDASTGELYARITGSWFYVGQGGWGGPRGPRSPNVALPDRSPDHILTLRIPENAARLYRLNGDYNPLHGTPEYGQELGYGGIILHGVYAYTRIAHEVLRTMGGSKAESLREFQARFSGPVRPSDEIEVRIWRMESGLDGWEIIFWEASVVGTGNMCLSGGTAVVWTSAMSEASKL